jgi:hypothetical protein
VGLGIVTALFLAVMSMFYLQHLPSKADLARLETDLRQEFGLYLSSAAPIELNFHKPDGEKGRLGIDVVCTMRPDLRKRPNSVGLHLDRIAESILDHPDWRGKIGSVTVSHAPPLAVTRTRLAPETPPGS